MNYINFNGKILPLGTPIIEADNRGLRYGDGLFETIKYKNNELILLDEHLARLWKGLQMLAFEIPKLFTPEGIQHQMLELVKKNGHLAARVRLTIIRGNGGIYDSINHSPKFIIQTWPIEEKICQLNENGLQLCIFKDAKKMADQFCNIKHNNFLPYFMGALFAKKHQYNDALILNEHDRVSDSTIANVFLVKDHNILTPALTEGCVAGIMRNFIIRQLFQSQFTVRETAIKQEDLLKADEVFLSNSIFNIRWVSAIEDKTYSNKLTTQLFKTLLETNPTIFC